MNRKRAGGFDCRGVTTASPAGLCTLVSYGALYGQMNKKQRQKDPLKKRYLRELKEDIGKYLVIFLLLLLSISEVSGYLVANDSMVASYNESFEKYNIEDGNFSTENKLNLDSRKYIEELGVRLNEIFYSERQFDNGNTLRIFKDRTDMDKVCLMEGQMPSATDEIAIDRMHADNNDINIGDILTSEGRTWKVTGLVALSDYSALFSSNNDTMFDAIKFGVAIVTDEEFDSFDNDTITWHYAWQYDTRPATDAEKKAAADEFLAGLNDRAEITDYIPEYLNQAIIYAGTDLTGDRVFMVVFLYIIIVIIAFVFAVTTNNTILKEANVIGTLRAMGYKKSELVGHYMMLPVAVTLVAALLGNIFGYTLMKDVNASLYYGSYSLTTYTTRWNMNAFIDTTVIPIIIMLVINVVILVSRLSLSPLKFLRRDLSRSKKKRAVYLNERSPIFRRFRLRVIFQNIPNYLILFVGILFANFLLIFGLMLPSILQRYQDTISETMLAKYQYILQLPANVSSTEGGLDSMISLLLFKTEAETENEDAEKFSVYQLKTLPEGNYSGEDVLIYGIQNDSRYIDLSLKEGDVYVTSAYSEKLGINSGDTITLKEPYEDKTYELAVTGIYDYEGALSVFMPMEDLNEFFNLGKGTFAGYFSESEITDISEKYIGQIIDYDSLTKVSRQLAVSMGNNMNIVLGFAVVMYLILMYLLSKTIIEKNAQSISMTKILGMRNGEISRLYMRPTAIVTILFLVGTLPLEVEGLYAIYNMYILTQMSGWIPFYLSPMVFVKIAVIGIASYMVVAIIEYKKIKKIPMDVALKNVE